MFRIIVRASEVSTTMVKLFLSQPKRSDSGTIDVILHLLNKLGSHIRSLVTGGGRSEARLWLCTALSTISISPRRQLNVFMRLLRPKPRKMQLVSQLLQMMFDKSPRKLGSVLAKRSYLLEKFFQGLLPIVCGLGNAIFSDCASSC